jgi:hypothetical protein
MAYPGLECSIGCCIRREDDSSWPRTQHARSDVQQIHEATSAVADFFVEDWTGRVLVRGQGVTPA